MEWCCMQEAGDYYEEGEVLRAEGFRIDFWLFQCCVLT